MSAALTKISEIATSLSRKKPLAVLALCAVAVCLAAWILKGDGQDAEDGLVEDDLFPELKLNGALGVSDSGSEPKTDRDAPFLLPDDDRARAVSPKVTEQDSDGPLFPGQPSFETVIQTTGPSNKIETAGFTQTPPPGAAKPIPAGTTRVTSNQPVWLTGTIELDTGSRGEKQPQ